MINKLKYEIKALSKKNPDKFQRFFREKRFYAIYNELNRIDAERNKQILDVGCGPGIIGKYLIEKGFNVSLLDYNKDFIGYAKRIFQEEKIKSDIYLQDIQKSFRVKKKYDIIYMSEVLEHLHKLEIVMKNLNNLLKQNGYLIITIPNHKGLARITEWLMSKRKKYSCWIEEHNEKICSKKALKYLLNKYNFSPEKLYTIFYLSQFVPIISDSLAKKIYHIETKTLSRFDYGTLIISISRKTDDISSNTNL